MLRDGRASILVVDDNPNKLFALETVLAPLGQRVVRALSGREALRRLLEEDFAVVLLDVRMTEMDGFETAELIRQRRRSERTPIIFVTAFAQAEADMARGYSLGAVDFVFSPIVPEVLRNKVSVFVDLHKKSEEVRRQSDRLRRLEELEHQRRLERAESGRRQAEARFATMLDIAGDAIIAVEDDWRIVLFNKAAERTFGQSAEATIGHRLDELIVHGLEGMLPVGVEHPSNGVRHEVRGQRPDGSEFPAEVSVARTDDGDRAVFTVILRDITERRDAEENVRRLNAALDQRLRTGVDMVADLAATLEPSEVLGRLLLRAAAAVTADRGTLLRLDPLRMVIEDSHEFNHAKKFDLKAGLSGQPLLQQAVRERRPIIAAPFEPALLPEVLRSWGDVPLHVAVLPLTVGDEVAAILLLGRQRDMAFSTDDLDMLQLIGNVAAVALRNAQLYSQAQESSLSKSEFLNLAAHELRTPLSVVRGYASMLIDGTLGPGPRQWERPLEVLENKLRELNNLVDDLLTAARTEAGEISAEPALVDLAEVVRGAVQRAEARAALLTGQITVEHPRTPVVAHADPDHVGRILDNLINNALTYSVTPPVVRLRVTEPAEVAVEDGGAGIALEVHERIFERFFRVNDENLGPKPGTGLGLYISRALAERQGGALRLDRSAPGMGSTFVLSLPPAPARVVRGSRRPKAAAEPDTVERDRVSA
jgi:PAS domain S-box-containing protein